MSTKAKVREHTPGPWDVSVIDGRPVVGPKGEAKFFTVAHISGGDGKNREANARLIALAPAMAMYLSRMRCCYKAPEVADEMCGHCIVCQAKKIEGI